LRGSARGETPSDDADADLVRRCCGERDDGDVCM
jgi:hypothetical protein